jgi:TPR repeat protein
MGKLSMVPQNLQFRIENQYSLFHNQCILAVVLLFGQLLLLSGCKQEPDKCVSDRNYESTAALLDNGEYQRAFPLIMKFADSGNPFAQRDIGWMYFNGFGVEQDVDEAISWYERAVTNGSADAVAKLADIYAFGNIGVVRCDRAIELLETAASFDAPEALLTLGNYYGAGICVNVNINRRDYYYERVLSTNKTPPILIGSMYLRGYGGGKLAREGVKLIAEHCIDNHSICGSELGYAYMKGVGVQKDDAKAYEYFLMAAKDGHTTCEFNVGLSLIKGKGTDKNIEQGLYWLKRAATKNHSMALSYLGYLYETGIGGEKSAKMAMKYYDKAALLGENKALARIRFLSE